MEPKNTSPTERRDELQLRNEMNNLFEVDPTGKNTFTAAEAYLELLNKEITAMTPAEKAKWDNFTAENDKKEVENRYFTSLSPKHFYAQAEAYLKTYLPLLNELIGNKLPNGRTLDAKNMKAMREDLKKCLPAEILEKNQTKNVDHFDFSALNNGEKEVLAEIMNYTTKIFKKAWFEKKFTGKNASIIYTDATVSDFSSSHKRVHMKFTNGDSHSSYLKDYNEFIFHKYWQPYIAKVVAKRKFHIENAKKIRKKILKSISDDKKE